MKHGRPSFGATLAKHLIRGLVLIALLVVQSAAPIMAAAMPMPMPMMEPSGHHEMAKPAHDCDHMMPTAATPADAAHAACGDHGAASPCPASVCCAHGTLCADGSTAIANFRWVPLSVHGDRTASSRMETPQSRPPRHL
jgi:hypothetical protein